MDNKLFPYTYKEEDLQCAHCLNCKAMTRNHEGKLTVECEAYNDFMSENEAPKRFSEADCPNLTDERYWEEH